MRSVFVDTNFWLAVSLPQDQWNRSAETAAEELGAVQFVTSDEVLVEFLNSLSRGPESRRIAAAAVRRILTDPNTLVIAQTRASFLDGLALYEHRLDKEYSLTDCISMEIMRSQGLAEILTHDRHFAQEGFKVLLEAEE